MPRYPEILPPKSITESQHLALPLLLLACTLFPGIVGANPVGDPLTSLGDVVQTGVVGIALAAEIALVSFLLIMLGGTGRRVPLVISVLALNVISYAIFIRSVLPMVENILFVESVIWLAEALGILAIARTQATRPVSMKAALGISLAGNLTSYLVGLVM